jgi:hypothetical protein
MNYPRIKDKMNQIQKEREISSFYGYENYIQWCQKNKYKNALKYVNISKRSKYREMTSKIENEFEKVVKKEAYSKLISE